MTPAVSVQLVIRWIRLLLFSWRSRTNWFVQNASVSWIENVLLSPIMRPTRQSEHIEEEESFNSPESGDETSYNLRYSNGDGPSTSRAAAALRSNKYYATKSTSHGPKGRYTSTTQSRNQVINKSSEQESSRRKQKNPRKRRPENVLFLREVRRLQSTTQLLIPKAPFGRLVREILLDLRTPVERITLTALEAIQEATEIYITQTLNDAYLLTQHRQRVTLKPSDIQILRVLRLIQ